MHGYDEGYESASKQEEMRTELVHSQGSFALEVALPDDDTVDIDGQAG